MLRLSVTKDEYLMVGKDVRITFLGGNNSTLRLMIDAPRDVNVARGKAIEKKGGREGSTGGERLLRLGNNRRCPYSKRRQEEGAGGYYRSMGRESNRTCSSGQLNMETK